MYNTSVEVPESMCFRLEKITLAKYKNISDRFPQDDVLVYGQRTQNTAYSRIGFLPVGYRPKNIMKLSSITYSGNNSTGIDSKSAQIEIYPNGLILLAQGSTGWVSLDGLSFRA